MVKWKYKIRLLLKFIIILKNKSLSFFESNYKKRLFVYKFYENKTKI